MSFDGALVLRYVAGVMKAGASLDEALRALSDESPLRLRREVVARLGAAVQQHNVMDRIQALFAGPEYMLARAALMLAYEAGGSVVPVLNRCASQLEERRRWAQRRRALSSQSVASAWIVGCMPFVLSTLLLLFAPDYVAPLFETTAGLICSATAGLLVLVGIAVVRRMVRSDV